MQAEFIIKHKEEMLFLIQKHDFADSIIFRSFAPWAEVNHLNLLVKDIGNEDTFTDRRFYLIQDLERLQSNLTVNVQIKEEVSKYYLKQLNGQNSFKLDSSVSNKQINTVFPELRKIQNTSPNSIWAEKAAARAKPPPGTLNEKEQELARMLGQVVDKCKSLGENNQKALEIWEKFSNKVRQELTLDTSVTTSP